MKDNVVATPRKRDGALHLKVGPMVKTVTRAPQGPSCLGGVTAIGAVNRSLDHHHHGLSHRAVPLAGLAVCW